MKLIAAPILLFAAQPAMAATIFQNGVSVTVQAPDDGLKSDSKSSFTGFEMSLPQTAASPFVLNTADTVAAISFEGFYFPYGVPPMTDVFQVAFYQNENGLPAERIGPILGAESITRTLAGVSTYGDDIYRFQLDLGTSVDLEAGTYWIALQHTSTYEDAAFFWSYNDRSGQAAYNEGDNGLDAEFLATNFRLVYTLENTKFVPEPSSIMFLSIAGSLIVVRRKRDLSITKA